MDRMDRIDLTVAVCYFEADFHTRRLVELRIHHGSAPVCWNFGLVLYLDILQCSCINGTCAVCSLSSLSAIVWKYRSLWFFSLKLHYMWCITALHTDGFQGPCAPSLVCTELPCRSSKLKTSKAISHLSRGKKPTRSAVCIKTEHL